MAGMVFVERSAAGRRDVDAFPGPVSRGAGRRPGSWKHKLDEGAFRDGRPHGAGRLTVQGAVFAFRFEQGRPVGKGSVTTAEGVVLSGTMVGGRFVPDA